MNFVGIFNGSEFCSDHYLADVFGDDSRRVLDAWRAYETGVHNEAKAKGEVAEDSQGYRAPHSTRCPATRTAEDHVPFPHPHGRGDYRRAGIYPNKSRASRQCLQQVRG